MFTEFSHKGQVILDWKDEKYRVTVKDLVFSNPYFGTITLTNGLTKKNRSEFLNYKVTKNALICLDSYFTELFNISNDNEW